MSFACKINFFVYPFGASLHRNKISLSRNEAHQRPSSRAGSITIVLLWTFFATLVLGGISKCEPNWTASARFAFTCDCPLVISEDLDQFQNVAFMPA